MTDEKNSSTADREIRVLDIVGCFLTFFGILLLIAVASEKTVSGRVTNLVAALILLAVGGGMFWRGVVHHRGAWRLPVLLFGALAVTAAVVSLCLSSSVSKARRETPPKVEGTPEKAAPAESVEPGAEETVESESAAVEEKKGRSFLVKAIRSAGWAMRDLVERISLRWLKLLTAIGFAAIAAVVWLVRRQTVFEGVTDRKWWRDLRLWTAVTMATQVVIYLLLGT